MWSYLADKRYRSERLLLVFGAPIALLALTLVIFLLASQENTLKKPVSLLTADKVEEAAPAPEIAKKATIDEVAKLFEQGKESEAMALLESPKAPPPAEGKALLAERALAAGDLTQASTLINEALKLDRQANFYRLRGDIRRSENLLDEALADYEEAIALDPSNVIANNRRLLLFIQRGQIELVRKTIQLRLDLGVSSQTELWIFAAAALELHKNFPQSAASFLGTAVTLVDPKTFDSLISDPVILPYQNEPLILPFYIKTSTSRNKLLPTPP